jgi:hypothetical protein
MSWSIQAVGKPEAVKAALAEQFKNAALSTVHIPHEQDSVIAIQAVVNEQLDFLMVNNPSSAVAVKANGSASVAPPGAMDVSPIAGFVE